MHGPVVVTWLLAALAAGSGTACLQRLRHSPAAPSVPGPGSGPGNTPGPGSATGRGCATGAGPGRGAVRRFRDRDGRREVDAAEAVMALGMAGMALLPGLLWAWLFALLAGTLLLGALGPAGAALRGHRLHHGIGALAMAYMAVAMAFAPAHLHHAAAPGLPLLTGLLLLYFGGYSVWEGGRLLTAPTAHPAHAAHTAQAVPVARLAQACRAAMGIGMFAMLLTM